LRRDAVELPVYKVDIDVGFPTVQPIAVIVVREAGKCVRIAIGKEISEDIFFRIITRGIMT